MASGKTVLTAVTAALKYLYPKGEPPAIINDQYKFHKALPKMTDFVGDSAFVPVKNANPQGVGANIAGAQAAVSSSTFNRFQVTRNKFFGVAQIDGEAAEAAVKTEGALVDLVSNETLGAAQSVSHDLAVYEYGNGSGVLGQLTGTSTGTTLTFTSTTNMNNLELGMSLNIVSSNSVATAPTTRKNGGGAAVSVVITSIDRKNNTIVVSATTSDAVTGDYVTRAGMCVLTNGVQSVFFGADTYIEGGTTPSTIYGLNRTTDPVRLAGQTGSYANIAMEDAVTDAAALVAQQGVGSPDTLIAHPLRIAQMKRSVGGKIIYDRNGSKDAAVGFSGLVFETEIGHVDILSDPYCPLQSAYLVKKSDWTLWSLKSAPHMCKFDGLEYLRAATDDSFEVRWRFYGAMKLTCPARQFRLTSFGA